MPTYEHLCNNCQHEWEDIYSMKQDPPTLCPSCNVEGKVQRLISVGSGRGIVEITGHELKAKMRAEGQELKRAALKDENLMANLVGEARYQKDKVGIEKDISNMGRPRIQSKRKSQR